MEVLNNVAATPTPYTLPNGVGVLEMPYDGDSKTFINAPMAYRIEGVVYGKSSHNSDTFKIVYRTDQVLAEIL